MNGGKSIAIREVNQVHIQNSVFLKGEHIASSSMIEMIHYQISKE